MLAVLGYFFFICLSLNEMWTHHLLVWRYETLPTVYHYMDRDFARLEKDRLLNPNPSKPSFCGRFTPETTKGL